MRPLFLFAVVAICWLLVLADQAPLVSAAELRRSLAEMKASPRNLAQACRGELDNTCNGATTDRIRCLADNLAQVQGDVCREWLAARAVCLDHVLRSPEGRCADAEEADAGHHKARRCLRKADPKALPAVCRESAYYRSLYKHKPRRGIEVLS